MPLFVDSWLTVFINNLGDNKSKVIRVFNLLEQSENNEAHSFPSYPLR